MNIAVICLFLFVLTAWLILRSLIKEGSITTNVPFIFLLSGRYKDEKS